MGEKKETSAFVFCLFFICLVSLESSLLAFVYCCTRRINSLQATGSVWSTYVNNSNTGSPGVSCSGNRG